MSFPMVALSEIVTPIHRIVDVIPGKSYRTIGVKWWGEGAYERETIDGSQTAAKNLSLVCEDDLIINKIWVRHGSTAIASKAVDGCAASNEFPTFNIKKEKVLPRWIHWLTKTKQFWMKCDNLSRGTSGKNRIKPELFLKLTVPLPPLSEQRHIVAHIEELAAKIEEARGLRKKAREEIEALLSSALHRQFNLAKKADIPKQPIATLATILRGRSPVYQEGSGKLAINQKCVRWNGIDIIHAKEVSEGWIESLPPNSFLQDNDILVNSTGEGTIGRACVLTQNAIGFPFDSHVLVVRVEKDKVLPIYITYYLRSPFGQKAIEDSKGAKTTKQTELGTTKLGEIIIPITPLPEQLRIIAYLDALQAKVNALRHLQAETSAELDALMLAVLDRAFKGEL